VAGVARAEVRLTGSGVGEHRGVDAAREGPAVSDDHEGTQVRVVPDRGAELAELAPHLDAERVEFLGATQVQPGDGPSTLEAKRLEAGLRHSG
jgi:hypothetical protein